MKKTLFAIFAIAACFASCSEVLESPVLNNEISFDNYVGKDATTKATIVTNVESVNVNAYLHKVDDATPFKANFMNAQPVTKTTSGETTSWTYSPAKFWPAADQQVDFVAWVPVNNADVTDATLDFDVPTEVQEQNDLLVAVPQLNKNYAGNNQAVGLTFKHLLSRIGFEIIATGIPSDDVNKVELVEVSLNGSFANYGSVDMTCKTNPTDVTVPIIVKASVPEDASEGATETTSKYTLTGKHFGWDDNIMTNATTEGEGDAATLVGVTNLANSYIMLIPDQNAPTHITVTYTVTTSNGDGKEPTVITNTANFALQPAEGTTPFKYEAGKAYKYIFTITMESITFDVTVEEWTDAEEKDIINNYTPVAE